MQKTNIAEDEKIKKRPTCNALAFGGALSNWFFYPLDIQYIFIKMA